VVAAPFGPPGKVFSNRIIVPSRVPRRPTRRLVPLAIVSHTTQSGMRDRPREHCLAIRSVKRMTPILVVSKWGGVTGSGVGREESPRLRVKSRR
jgi:hypothetical protein